MVVSGANGLRPEGGWGVTGAGVVRGVLPNQRAGHHMAEHIADDELTTELTTEPTTEPTTNW